MNSYERYSGEGARFEIAFSLQCSPRFRAQHVVNVVPVWRRVAVGQRRERIPPELQHPERGWTGRPELFGGGQHACVALGALLVAGNKDLRKRRKIICIH